MRVFVIRSFGVKKDSAGTPVDFDRVHRQLIEPALARCGYGGGTTGQIAEAGNIRADMFALILEADIVICDITVHNANVFYELGVRHALRKKHTVLIKGDASSDTTPFDLSTDRYLGYPSANPADAVDSLVAAIRAGVDGRRETDSPIFLMLPTLQEADASRVCMVPLDFIEEVERAEASSDKGLLRLLAEDVRGERFQWDGLKAIGRSQWSLNDFDGARVSWELVREARPQDLESNLALANIYERLYRAAGQAALLERSNQALRSVLDRGDLSRKDRAEALALKGRNLKTLWRLGFQNLASVEERRARALDGKLLQSYEAYLEAFRADLNGFYAGISALQMGFILKSFSETPGWRNLFGGIALKAARYREDLDAQLGTLEHVVAASISGAVERLEGDARMWARISDADLLFLTGHEQAQHGDADPIIAAYTAAIPGHKRFARDAAAGQLALFASLGIHADTAEAVIKALGSSVPVKSADKALHLVVFSGHRVDAPGATVPRFPAHAEARAKALIEARLRAQQRDDERVIVLSSAAPGADILAHEVCSQQGIRSVLFLPLPASVVAREAFERHDAWHHRLFAVVEAHEPDVLILQNDPEMPRWLRQRGMDVWERGNRWAVKLAEAWGADRVTLVALWDGNEEAASSGGTAQMVRLARQSGIFGIEVIDSRELIAGA